MSVMALGILVGAAAVMASEVLRGGGGGEDVSRLGCVLRGSVSGH